MKKYVIVLFVAILLSSCSSVKLDNSWKSNQFDLGEGDKVLVAAKSPFLYIRQSYENTLSGLLNEKNIEATEIHNLLPDFETVENQSEEEVNRIVNLFKQNGISHVLVLSLRNTKVETNDSPGNYEAYVPSDQFGRYFLTFNSGDDPNNLPRLPRTDEPDPTVVVPLRSTTYTLEAVTFDLSLEADKRLISIITVDITDPSSAEEVLNGFAKTVVRELSK